MTPSDVYLLVQATGSEGPFTPDELRDLVRRGRARAGDRIYHPINRTTSEVRHVVPEADALEKAAVRPSDRIRRTTSDRQQAVAIAQAERRRSIDLLPPADGAPAAQTLSSDPLPEVSPPESAATAAPCPTSECTKEMNISAGERSTNFRTIVIGCLLLAAAVWGYALWYPNLLGGGILQPPPDIPALSAAELATLPDHHLLERVELECLRRLYAADQGPRAAAAVLSPPASRLWIIGSGETQLRSFGFRQALMIERAPELSPVMPTFKQMATAYRALDLSGPARALEDALGIVDPGNDDDPYATVQQRYLTEIATQSAFTRLAYARANRSELFPLP